jgi:hypothetical protein
VTDPASTGDSAGAVSAGSGVPTLSMVAFASHGSAVPGTLNTVAFVETVTAAKPQTAARVVNRVLSFIYVICFSVFAPQPGLLVPGQI